MSTTSHNLVTGIVLGISGLAVAAGVIHHNFLNPDKLKIVSEGDYSRLAETYVPAASLRGCIKLEDFGTRGPTKTYWDQQCMGNSVPSDDLQKIGDYNNYHRFPSNAFRTVGDLVIGVGGTVITAVLLVNGTSNIREGL